MSNKFIRIVDLFASLIGLIFLFPFLLGCVVFGWFDTGSPIFFQERIGRNEKIFKLIKFRTMKKDTPSIASHLVQASSITRYGRFLRLSKVDELPQLFNVLMGHMSLVGARPCLPSQKELICLRKIHGVFEFKPGITGLAQINNIDMSNPAQLVAKEVEMYSEFGVKKYLFYVIMTIGGKGRGDATSRV